jgi:hypothetical protein
MILAMLRIQICNADPKGSVKFWEADPNRSKVKIPEILRLKMELWKAADAHIGGVEAQNDPFCASASAPFSAVFHKFYNLM